MCQGIFRGVVTYILFLKLPIYPNIYNALGPAVPASLLNSSGCQISASLAILLCRYCVFVCSVIPVPCPLLKRLSSFLHLFSVFLCEVCSVQACQRCNPWTTFHSPPRSDDDTTQQVWTKSNKVILDLTSLGSPIILCRLSQPKLPLSLPLYLFLSRPSKLRFLPSLTNRTGRSPILHTF